MTQRRNAFGCAVVGLFLLTNSMAVSADVIQIRSDIWLPYAGEPDSDSRGYMIEMAEAIAAKHGHTINHESIPWEDALNKARQGDASCVVGAAIRDAPDLLFAKSSWGTASYHLWGRVGTEWRYSGIPSLAAIKFSVNEYYSYDEPLDGYIAANRADKRRLLEVSEKAQAIAQLIDGKTDAYLDDPNEFNFALMKAGIDPTGFISLGEARRGEDVYIACTPGKPRGRQLAEMFDAGTDELRSSGKLAEILARYSIKDWK